MMDNEITINAEEATLVVPHLGMTTRTLMAAAAEGYKTNPKRIWKVSYKNTIIGNVRLKTNFLKEEDYHARLAERAKESS